MMIMNHPIAMHTSSIPGVSNVTVDEGKLHVEFTDGTKATVAECPIARTAGREAVDVWFPNANPGALVPHEVAPNLSFGEALALLDKTAAKAAQHNTERQSA